MMIEASAKYARKASATSLVQSPKPIRTDRRTRLAHGERKSRLVERVDQRVPRKTLLECQRPTWRHPQQLPTLQCGEDGSDLRVFRGSTRRVGLSENISPNDFVGQFHVWFLQHRRRCTAKRRVSTCQSTRIRRDARRSRHPPLSSADPAKSWVPRHAEDFTRALPWNTSGIFGAAGTGSRRRTRARVKQDTAWKHQTSH